MELWVHGPKPWGAWTRYIHPPGYSLFMNLTDLSASRFGGSEQAVFHQIFWQGLFFKCAVMLLITWALTRWKNAGWGLFGAALYAVSPNTLRPFEQYPLATLLSAFAVVALVEWGLRPGRGTRTLAIVAVLGAVLLHLSVWFVVAGMVAALFFSMPGRRKEIALVAAAMTGIFMLTTYPGLYTVLEAGNSITHEHEVGFMAIEWTNPALLAAALLVFIPSLWRERLPVVLGFGVLSFTGVTLVLQYVQLADGKPYPYGLHYFELLEPAMVFAAVWALASLRERARGSLRWGVLALCGGLLLSQLLSFVSCQAALFLDVHWFWKLLTPWGGLG